MNSKFKKYIGFLFTIETMIKITIACIMTSITKISYYQYILIFWFIKMKKVLQTDINRKRLSLKSIHESKNNYNVIIKSTRYIRKLYWIPWTLCHYFLSLCWFCRAVVTSDMECFRRAKNKTERLKTLLMKIFFEFYCTGELSIWI